MTLSISASTGEITSWEGNDPAKWEFLVKQMRRESPNVARFSARQLHDRWLQGLAAVSINDDLPVAYTSLVKIPVDDEIATFPVYEAATTWTMERYRKQGLQQKMQRLLHSCRKNSLLITFCAGKGASIVHQKNNWTLLCTDAYSNLAGLLGIYVNKTLMHRLGDQIDLGSRTPLVLDDDGGNACDWDQHVILWASSKNKADLLEAGLSRSG